MAIQHHPLSNAALGEYQGFRHIGKVTVFAYSLGFVELSCPDNTAFKWSMHLDTDIKAIADKAEKDYWAKFNQLDNERVNPGYQGLDQHSIDGMDDMAFGCKICGNTHELGINKEGICFGCSYEGDRNSLDSRSAADEASININHPNNYPPLTEKEKKQGYRDEASTDTVRKDIADKTNEMLANEFYEMTFIGQSLAESFKKD